jgi:ATP-dependent RNA helicase DDX49/DBP8
MEHPNRMVGLSEAIERAIQNHLAKSDSEWPLVDGLSRPVLRIEAFIEDGCPGETRNNFSEKIASVCSPSSWSFAPVLTFN